MYWDQRRREKNTKGANGKVTASIDKLFEVFLTYASMLIKWEEKILFSKDNQVWSANKQQNLQDSVDFKPWG